MFIDCKSQSSTFYVCLSTQTSFAHDGSFYLSQNGALGFMVSSPGLPFWAGERRILPDDNNLRLLNWPEPIFHNNHILKSLNICLQGKIHLVRYTLHKYIHKYVCHKVVINFRRLRNSVSSTIQKSFQEVPLRGSFNHQCIG